jgi:hypothetical protein
MWSGPYRLRLLVSCASVVPKEHGELWWYSGVKVVFPWCYSVAMVLQWCYSVDLVVVGKHGEQWIWCEKLTFMVLQSNASVRMVSDWCS